MGEVAQTKQKIYYFKRLLDYMDKETYTTTYIAVSKENQAALMDLRRTLPGKYVKEKKESVDAVISRLLEGEGGKD